MGILGAQCWVPSPAWRSASSWLKSQFWTRTTGFSAFNKGCFLQMKNVHRQAELEPGTPLACLTAHVGTGELSSNLTCRHLCLLERELQECPADQCSRALVWRVELLPCAWQEGSGTLVCGAGAVPLHPETLRSWVVFLFLK